MSLSERAKRLVHYATGNGNDGFYARGTIDDLSALDEVRNAVGLGPIEELGDGKYHVMMCPPGFDPWVMEAWLCET